jgi:hypothetical protein
LGGVCREVALAVLGARGNRQPSGCSGHGADGCPCAEPGLASDHPRACPFHRDRTAAGSRCHAGARAETFFKLLGIDVEGEFPELQAARERLEPPSSANASASLICSG